MHPYIIQNLIDSLASSMASILFKIALKLQYIYMWQVISVAKYPQFVPHDSRSGISGLYLVSW